MENKKEKVALAMDLIKNVVFLKFKCDFPRLKDTGLHPGQIFIIKIIHDNEGIKQKELAELTKRERATITKSLQRLEKKGFIIKENDLSDKKSPRLYLTDKAKELHKELIKEREKEIDNLSNSLTSTELDTLLDLLNKINDYLKENSDEKNI